MKFNNFAYIFLGPNLDVNQHRSVISNEKLTFTAVGVAFDNKEAAINVAKELVKNGAQMIELCGGFGPIWVAKISEALNFSVPVGSVAYGPETRRSLLDLLS